MAAFVYERIDFVSTKESSWVLQGKLMRVVRHRVLGSWEGGRRVHKRST